MNVQELNMQAGNTKELRVIGLYCRCSTNEQNVESQEDYLVNWLKRKNPDYPYKIYLEKETGTTFKRSKIEEIRTDLDNGVIQDLAVVETSRFGRNTLEGLQFLKWLIHDKLGNLYCVSEGLDTTTPMGRHLITFMLSMAEMDQHKRKESQKRGIDKCKDPITGKCPWGRKGKRNPYKLVPKTVEAIIELRKAGWNQSEIARNQKISRKSVNEVCRKNEISKV